MIEQLKNKVKGAALSPLQKKILLEFIDEDLRAIQTKFVNEKIDSVISDIDTLIEDYKDTRSALDIGVYAGLVMAEEIVKAVKE